MAFINRLQNTWLLHFKIVIKFLVGRKSQIKMIFFGEMVKLSRMQASHTATVQIYIHTPILAR